MPLDKYALLKLEFLLFLFWPWETLSDLKQTYILVDKFTTAVYVILML